MSQTVKLGGELVPQTVSEIALDAKYIIDRENNGVKQSDINHAVGNLSGGSNFVTLLATSADTNIGAVFTRENVTPAVNTLYRIGNWKHDGSPKYNVNYYSVYGANGTTIDDLVPVALSEIGIDTQPTPGSTNLITSGAVAASIVYDISAAHSGAGYETLAAALGTNGNNVPDSVRKGGMSIKFIKTTPASYSVVKTEGLETQPTGTEVSVNPNINSGTYTAAQLNGAFSTLPTSSALTYWMAVSGETTTYTKWVISLVHTSDNKYVQSRCITAEFSVNPDDWESIETMHCVFFDMAISDNDNNHIVGFKDGHIRTKNFDSSKDATTEERGLMSAEDKVALDESVEKLSTIEEGAEVNEVETVNTINTDLDFSDEQNNIVMRLTNGHIKTKKFDSSKNASTTESGLMSSSDKAKLDTIEEGAEINNTNTDNTVTNEDFDISDENDNIILLVKNGFLKTKNFDSSLENWSKLHSLNPNNPIHSIMQAPGFGKIFRNWGFIGDSLSSGETWGNYDKALTINVFYTDKKISTNGLENEAGSVVTETFTSYGYKPKITLTFNSDTGLNNKILAAIVQNNTYISLCVGESGKTSYTFDISGIVVFSYPSENEPLYRFQAEYVNDNYDISWGQYLCRLLNVSGYNYAVGGETALSFCTYGDNGRRWNSLSDQIKEAYFIALGQNDSNLFLGGGSWSNYPCVTNYPNASDYTEQLILTRNDVLNDIDLNNYNNNLYSFAGYYCRILQRVKELQPKGYIFIVTDPFLTEIGNSKWNDCIRIIYQIYKEIYNDSIWLIDLDTYITNINEIKPKISLNGLHSSAFGYCYVSYIMNTYLDWIIRNNIDAFRRTSLIGTECDS